MENVNSNRNKWVHVRLNEAEFLALKKTFSKTQTRNLSEYVRRIILGKPMIGTYRNSSLDALMEELIRLRKDLNNVGNNFNQAVHKLHTCDTDQEIKTWLITYEMDKRRVLRQMEEIRAFIGKNAEKWLQ